MCNSSYRNSLSFFLFVISKYSPNDHFYSIDLILLQFEEIVTGRTDRAVVA
jgi:hypothetical protein